MDLISDLTKIKTNLAAPAKPSTPTPHPPSQSPPDYGNHDCQLGLQDGGWWLPWKLCSPWLWLLEREAALRGLLGLWTLPSWSFFSLGSGRFEGAPGIVASLVTLSSQITPRPS